MSNTYVPDDWITPVTRKEKKARRRQELTPEKETQAFDMDASDNRKSAPVAPVEPPKPVEPTKSAEKTKSEPPAPQRSAAEKKGRSGKSEMSSKVALPSVEVKPVEKSKSEKEDDAKSKKSSKQKARATEVVEEPSELFHAFQILVLALDVRVVDFFQ